MLPEEQVPAAPADTLRVLHLLSGEGLYGAERAVLSLAAQGRATGDDHRLGLVGLEEDDPRQLVVEEARALAIPVELLTAQARQGVFGWRSAVMEAITIAQPDIVHVHGYKAAVLGAVTRSTSRGRWGLVATLHGWTSLGRPGRVMAYELLERVSLVACDAVVAVSEDLCARVRRFPGVTPVSCVANPVPVRPERSTAPVARLEGVKTLCYVGRLSQEKGVDLLLHAFARLSANRDDLRLLIAGEGNERQHLTEDCARLGLSERVQFLGFLSDPRPLFAAADLVVLPSRTEGMPLVVLEALAAMAPVLATDVGEVRQLLADGQYGWIVSRGSVDALVGGIESALAAPDDTKSRSVAGASAVLDRFGLASVYARYRRVYVSVVSKRGTQSRFGSLAW